MVRAQVNANTRLHGSFCTGTSGIDQTLAAGYAGTGLSQRSSGTDGASTPYTIMPNNVAEALAVIRDWIECEFAELGNLKSVNGDKIPPYAHHQDATELARTALGLLVRRLANIAANKAERDSAKQASAELQVKLRAIEIKDQIAAVFEREVREANAALDTLRDTVARISRYYSPDSAQTQKFTRKVLSDLGELSKTVRCLFVDAKSVAANANTYPCRDVLSPSGNAAVWWHGTPPRGMDSLASLPCVVPSSVLDGVSIGQTQQALAGTGSGHGTEVHASTSTLGGTGAGTGTSGIDQTLAAGYAGTGLSQRSSGTDGTGAGTGTSGIDQTLAAGTGSEHGTEVHASTSTLGGTDQRGTDGASTSTLAGTGSDQALTQLQRRAVRNLVKLCSSSKAVAGRQSTHDGDDQALAGAGGPRSLLDGGVSIVGQAQGSILRL